MDCKTCEHCKNGFCMCRDLIHPCEKEWVQELLGDDFSEIFGDATEK